MLKGFKQRQVVREEENKAMPPKSKPVWKSIEEEVKKEDRAGVMREMDVEDQANNQLDTSKIRKLNTNNASS